MMNTDTKILKNKKASKQTNNSTKPATTPASKAQGPFWKRGQKK